MLFVDYDILDAAVASGWRRKEDDRHAGCDLRTAAQDVEKGLAAPKGVLKCLCVEACGWIKLADELLQLCRILCREGCQLLKRIRMPAAGVVDGRFG